MPDSAELLLELCGWLRMSDTKDDVNRAIDAVGVLLRSRKGVGRVEQKIRLYATLTLGTTMWCSRRADFSALLIPT